MVYRGFLCLLCMIIETVFATCTKEELKGCKEDEYFDKIICSCSRCVDICQPRPDRSTRFECEQNCPEYSQQTFTVKSHREMINGNLSKSLPTNSTGPTGTSILVAQFDNDDSLIRKPLFWTSVISVLISIVATIILIILCVCKKSRPMRRLFCRRLPSNQHTAKLSLVQKETESQTGNSQGMVYSAEKTYESGLSSGYNIPKGGYLINYLQDHRSDCFMVQPETFASDDRSNQSSYLQGPGVGSLEGSRLFRTGVSMMEFDLKDDKEIEFYTVQSSSTNDVSDEFSEQTGAQECMESITNRKEPYRFAAESGFNETKSCFVPSGVANISLVGCSVF